MVAGIEISSWQPIIVELLAKESESEQDDRCKQAIRDNMTQMPEDYYAGDSTPQTSESVPEEIPEHRQFN